MQDDRPYNTQFQLIDELLASPGDAQHALQEIAHEARRLARENAIVAEIGRIISSSPNIQEIYEGFAEEVRKLIPFDRLVINIVDMQAHTMKTLYQSGVHVPGWEPGVVRPLANTPSEWVVNNRSSLIVDSESEEAFLKKYPNQTSSVTAGLRWLIIVPLISKNQIIGALHFRSSKPNAYSNKDLIAAERVANQIAGAIANAELYAAQSRAQEALRESEEEARWLAQEIAIIAEIGRIITSSLDIEEVYEGFAEAVHKLIPFDRISISIYDRKKDMLTSAYAIGVEVAGRQPGDVFPASETVAEEVIRTRSSLMVQSATAELMERYPSLAASGMRSILMAPMVHKNEIIGVLNLRSLEEYAYTQDHLDLVTQVAAEITPAVVNARLYAEQSRLASLPVHNPNPVIETDLFGNVSYCNPVARQRFPELPEVGGKHPILTDLKSIIADLWPGEQEFVTREVQVRDEVYEQKIVYIPESTLIRIYSNDITLRKRAQEALTEKADELARSNAELQEFAYVASHDLQEPLRVISGFVQLLSDRYSGKLDSSADEFIGYVVDGTRRMQALINDLLEYSRVGTQGQHLELISSGDALEQAISNLGMAIEDSGALVTHDEMPRVKADFTQLGQLFQNFISNAIKFRGDEKPRIHVSSTLDENSGEWVISVADNGIGIAPQHQERIFGMFKRLHGRSDYPGTGIGLAICSKIIERHGGRIWVESEPGKGSTFSFTLPAGDM